MADIGRTEENVSQKDISREYELLISRFPMENLSESLIPKASFPDWNVTAEETTWANSFLDLGKNEEILKVFGESVGRVGKRGLELLREQSKKQVRETTKKLEEHTTPELLLSLLRDTFQSDALFLEEGLRGVRNVNDNYWSGEGNQLTFAVKELRSSKDAFIEVDKFQAERTGKLHATRFWINANFNAVKNTAEHNNNFFREHLGDGISKEEAEFSVKQDDKDLIFWTSLKGYVDNLELAGKQGNRE